MTNLVGGEVMTANREDLFIASCQRCEKILGVSRESRAELLPILSRHTAEKGHNVYIGPVTVGPMIEWLENLLNEQGLRGEEVVV